MKTCVLFSLLCWTMMMMIHQVLSSYCSTGQSKPGDPSLPVINETAFIIEYQINIVDRQYTMWAREDYDYAANKVRMTMLKDGAEEGILLDYRNNLIVSYAYSGADRSSYSCSIDQLNTSDSDNFNVFGGLQRGKGSMPHLYSSSDVFRFGSSVGETYMGTATIDGVVVHHWQSCMYWPDDKDNFTLDYYFTTSDWVPIDPIGPRQIPVRAVLIGVKDTGQSKPYKLNHVYEYLNFRVLPRLPEETFALPINMKCEDPKGLKHKAVPTLPKRMSYTVEIVASDASVRMMDVLYDEDRQLVRSSEKNIISIDDFNTGIHYRIDKTRHNCFIRPVSADTDSAAVSSDTPNFVRMKSREELFYLDGDFTYSGQVDRRGVACDAWVRTAVVHQANNDIEVYFSLKSEHFENSAQTLVSVVVSSPDNATTYNFFNEDLNPDTSTNPFDTSMCRNESSKQDFRLMFGYSSDGAVMPHRHDQLIHDYLSALVVNLTKVDYIQILWSDVEWDETNAQLHWLGSFLDPEPSFIKGHDRSSVSASQAISILQQAISNTSLAVTISLPAVGRAEPVNLHLLALEISDVKSDVDFTDNLDVSIGQFVFSNNVQAMGYMPEESMFATSVLYCANICVERSIYECRSFSYCVQAKRCLLSSDRWFDAPMSESPGCDFYRRKLTSDFTKMPGETARPQNGRPTLGVSSVQTCARFCLNETQCESFDYCQSTEDCYLNPYHSYSGSSSAHLSSACDHYSKNYVFDYIKNSSTALVPKDSSVTPLVIVTDSSPTECAYMCSQDHSFECVRFGFCAPTHQCQLVSRALVELIPAQHDPTCDVYTLRSAVSTTLATRGPHAATTHTSRSSHGDQTTTCSPGSMAGLAIGMIIVGISITFLTIVVLRRYKVWEPY